MKLGVNKVKKGHGGNFEKKILIRGLRGIKCQKFGFWGNFSGTGSLKISNFLHDARGQYWASFGCGAIFGKNINLGIKGD